MIIYIHIKTSYSFIFFINNSKIQIIFIFSFFFSFRQKRVILNKIIENNNNSNEFRNFFNIDFINFDNNRTFTSQFEFLNAENFE